MSHAASDALLALVFSVPAIAAAYPIAAPVIKTTFFSSLMMIDSFTQIAESLPVKITTFKK